MRAASRNIWTGRRSAYVTNEGPASGDETPRRLASGQRTAGLLSGASAARLYYLLAAGMVIVLTAYPNKLGGSNFRAVDFFGASFWLLAATGTVPASRRATNHVVPVVKIVAVVLAMFCINGVLWYDNEVFGELALKCLRLTLILGPLVASSTVQLSPQQAASLLRFVAAGAVIGVGGSVVAYMNGIDAVFAHQTLAVGETRVNRLGGLVGETGAFAFYTLVGVGAVMMVGARTKRMVPAGLLAVGLWVASLNFTAARVSLITVTPLVLVLAWRMRYWGRSRWLIPIVFGAALVAVLVSLDTIVGSTVASRSLDVADGKSLTSGRSERWENLLSGFLANPLIGRGYRSSELVGTSENLLVQLLAEFGALGALVVAMSIQQIGKITYRAAARLGSVESAVVGALLGGMLLQWMVNDISTYHQAMPLALVMLGVVPFLQPTDQ